MMPVAHLARDGFTPVAMGMVLCNDANITEYVNMVQGLHAEGVVCPLYSPLTALAEDVGIPSPELRTARHLPSGQIRSQ